MKILHDIHTHNIFSNCCRDQEASTSAYLKKEAELGMKLFGLSNHIWDPRVNGYSEWYRLQTITKAEEAKVSFSQAAPGLKVLFGAETEYFACHDRLGMSVDGAAHFDYLLIPHTHMHMRNNVMWDYPEIMEARADIKRRLQLHFPELNEVQIHNMAETLKVADLIHLVPEMRTEIHEYICNTMVQNFLALLENEELRKICGRVPVSVAHPFAPCNVPDSEKKDYIRLLQKDVLKDCFSRAAALGIAMEINVSAVRETSPELAGNEMIRVLSIAKEAGCKFTFGTDSHTVQKLEWIRFGDEIADALQLSKADLAEHVADAVEE